MNTRFFSRRGALLVAMNLGLMVSTTVAAEDFRFESHLLSDTLMVEPMDAAALDSDVDLIIKGPNSYLSRIQFRRGQPVEFGVNDLADGTYRYELQLMGNVGLPEARDVTLQGASGVFTIVDGRLVDRDLTETADAPPDGMKRDGISSTASANRVGGASSRDQLVNDNQSIVGSLCVGQDCTNGESFGFDTIRIKENNTRIRFDDTSNSASFPNVDWQLTANETTNGGANKFSIDDLTNGRTPFTLEAGAPTHSLFVDDGGRMGLGTSTPVVEMHMVDGDTPTMRLDQNGSSGFTPQIWDLAGNEANFFVRDVTNGSKLPLKIQPNSPTDAVVLEQAGTRFGNLTTFSANVGMGVNTADHQLQVRGDGSVAPVKIEETDGTNLIREMLLLSNNGGSTIQFEDTSGDLHDWQVSATRFGFFITEEDSGTTEFILSRGTGNLTIAGTLSENSDITRKTNIEPVDPAEVLARVAELPISTWAYKEDEQTLHLGPMAQDFFQQFGLGASERQIATIDTSGVALAAIQGLKQELDRRDDEIRALRGEIERLNQAVGTQAELVSQIEELAMRMTTVEQVQDKVMLEESIEQVRVDY
ncbi:MAG: tail fiber domain-containing protein [Pseudomonadota bacterium]